MSNALPTLQELWQTAEFRPNPRQEEAITYNGGPLFLTAGPGSGKTRVLLWRALNLMVHCGVKPEEIFLATFTEKAALQLKEGLQALLEYVTDRTGAYYDLSKMYVGTIHSLCQRIVDDRCFSADRQRPHAPILMDELEQYLHLYRNRTWQELLSALGWKNANAEVNAFFERYQSRSRHKAVSNCISLFNRFSEECLHPAKIRGRADDATLRKLIDLYEEYRRSLQNQEPALTDFALLQQAALDTLDELDKRTGENRSGRVFTHVIIDEYQDTNTIQEKLIFRLASGHKQLCVVGDDDQALYRFRGATVENFVEFHARCQQHLGVVPNEIPLDENYRSRKKIVSFYCAFMTHPTCDWRRDRKTKSHYRVIKDLKAHRKDEAVSVVASDPDRPLAVCAQIAGLVKKIIDAGKVDDPNQVVFLYPSLKSAQVGRMKDALEKAGLKVYAPRAGSFLDVDEAVDVLGLFMHVFGKPERGDFLGKDYATFYDWVDTAYDQAESLVRADPALTRYVKRRAEEIEQVVSDYRTLTGICDHEGWGLDDPYKPEVMRSVLLGKKPVSGKARRAFVSPYLARLIEDRAAAGRPFTLKYMILRATSLDWNVLDLFYRLCGFRHFRDMFQQAENVKKDEGPVCNLSLLSQYLARFVEGHGAVLSAQFLEGDKFIRTFFGSYLYALYRRGESEYEDAEDPFPRGRIPFLTIHQAKGLEFPVVVLGNPRKGISQPQRIEQIVQPLLKRKGEPLDRMAQFDAMRMFYVALSRAKNLLVIAHYRGPGQQTNEPFRSMLDDDFPRISQYDIKSLPKAEIAEDELPKTYSYTGDFLLYKRCPLQYMTFRKYGFVPSRSQTMFFGSLVHQTIEDLHQHLIAARGGT